MTLLNQPLTIKSVTFRNRIAMPPMCMYSANNGFATDWHFVHYGTRAIGGAGLIILEATAVTPEGRITPFDLGIWIDEHISELSRIARFLNENGSVPGIQIAHAGRKASHDSPAAGGKQLGPNEEGWITCGPSAIPFDASEVAPVELDAEGIKSVVSQFKNAALRASKAGFKVVEIHAAHGYLIHEFLSPLSNKRTDEYGGSFENRIRLLLEVVEAVKTVWPSDLPLFVRLSATDWVEGGWNPEETVKLCSILNEMGVDLIDCSSGGNIVNAKIPVAPGYQVHFAEAIRQTGIRTAAVGLITTVEQINEILTCEKADLVLLGRLLLSQPYFPLLATQNTASAIERPVQYLRGL